MVLEPRRLGAVVRTLRVHAGWDQAELGRRCGYSASQISRWETGRSALRNTRILEVLARALDVPSTVFGLTDGEPAWLAFTPLPDVVAPRPPRPLDRAPDPPRRRWSLRGRDLLGGPTYLITAVDVVSGTVNLYSRGPVVLEAADVRRLQEHLADALACVLADGGGW